MSHEHDERSLDDRADAPDGDEALDLPQGASNTSLAARAAAARKSGRGGETLPGDLRGDLETALSTDLASVRVHDSAESADAAGSASAKAFAVGDDIFFGAGQYQPGTTEGNHLLAHEVAHTVQQRGGPQVAQTKLEVSQEGSTTESEADGFADSFIAGDGRVGAADLSSAGPGIMREPADRVRDKPEIDYSRASRGNSRYMVRGTWKGEPSLWQMRPMWLELWTGGLPDDFADAVAAFQSAEKITVDGILGPGTMSALRGKSDKKIDPERTRQSNQLYAQGLWWEPPWYRKEEKRADWVTLREVHPALATLWTLELHDAFVALVASVQANLGLEETGVLGPALWSRLAPPGQVIASTRLHASTDECTQDAEAVLRQGFERATGEKLFRSRKEYLAFWRRHYTPLGEMAELPGEEMGQGPAAALKAIGVGGDVLGGEEIFEQRALKPGAAIQAWKREDYAQVAQGNEPVSKYPGTAAIFSHYVEPGEGSHDGVRLSVIHKNRWSEEEEQEPREQWTDRENYVHFASNILSRAELLERFDDDDVG